jgi:hypothetical protein
MTMKKFTNILFVVSLIGLPLVASAQTQDTLYYKKKVRRTVTGTNVQDVIKDTINKETGPILNDNGTISTTGTIDGRSSTGRDLEKQNEVKVRNKKKVSRTGDPVRADTIRKRKNRQ